MARARQTTDRTITAAAVLGKEKKASRGVTLMKDHVLTLPEIWLSVFILGDAAEQRAFAEMMVRSHCTKADSLEEADLVVFTGGVDVNPQLYNESQHQTVSFHRQRDIDDFNAYVTCLDKGIPMFGVCRGAQFLHVMNGGKLYQHIDGHQGDHQMYVTKDRYVIPKISSVHHQSCRPNLGKGMEVLGTSSRSHKRWKNAADCDEGTNQDIEAFWYRDTACLGVQGHPEYRGYHQYTKWCLDQISDLIVYNPDCYWEKNIKTGLSKYRVKPDILAQRKLAWEKQEPESESILEISATEEKK